MLRLRQRREERVSKKITSHNAVCPSLSILHEIAVITPSPHPSVHMADSNSPAAAKPSTSTKPKASRVGKSSKDKSDKEKKRKHREKKKGKEEKKRKEERERLKAASSKPLMEVTVNDRLGTKAKIPIYHDDKISTLKGKVSARTGIPVHAILLKRQGERPFRNELTCEDYSISNGTQIDLEVDTGD